MFSNGFFLRAIKSCYLLVIVQFQRRSSPFRRVKAEEVLVDPRLNNNSFEAKVNSLSGFFQLFPKQKF